MATVGTGVFIFAVAFAAGIAFLIPALRELHLTLKAYRNMEPRIVALLDNSRRITENVEEISRNVLHQTTKIEQMTEEATEMVDHVKQTVNLYNRTVARPAIFIASLASGMKGVSSVLFRNRK
ncbi:MAG: DUF948 domain-containing protein [Candidatus Hydrogenedentota bacterium]